MSARLVKAMTALHCFKESVSLCRQVYRMRQIKNKHFIIILLLINHPIAHADSCNFQGWLKRVFPSESTAKSKEYFSPFEGEPTGYRERNISQEDMNKIKNILEKMPLNSKRAKIAFNYYLLTI